MSSIVNRHQQSIDLIERFADCLLEDSPNETDVEIIKQLGSFVLYFSNEIKFCNEREQIYKNFCDIIKSATEKPDSESMIKQFQTELEKTEKQSKNKQNCEEYKNFMKKLSKFTSNKNEGDIEVVTQTITNIDPITKLPIEEPVKNKKCGHIYDKNSILKLITQNPKTRCPIAGCNAADYVKKSDLVSDNSFKRTLSNLNDNNVSKKLKTV